MYKPYDFVRVQAPGYQYVGEVMSYPIPGDTIMVRRAPDHPGTLDELPLSALLSQAPRPYRIVYARVTPINPRPHFHSFPVSMLALDHAAPVNFRLVDSTDASWPGSTAVRLPQFGMDGLWVVAAALRGDGSNVFSLDCWEDCGWMILETNWHLLGHHASHHKSYRTKIKHRPFRRGYQ